MFCRAPRRRGGRRFTARRSAAAEVPIEVDRLGALLEAEDQAEIGRLAAVERDRLLDMVGDAAALGILRNFDGDAEGLLADDRLVGADEADEIGERHRVAVARRAALGGDD